MQQRIILHKFISSYHLYEIHGALTKQ